MIEVAEALAAVLAECRSPAPIHSWARHALGCRLAEDVTSDVDSPPHDKSIVDGFAVRSADCQNLPVALNVVERITAGDVPTRSLARGEAAQIMTGAPLPTGADAVVMIEKTDAWVAGRRRDELLSAVQIQEGAVRPEQNIVRRGKVMRTGDRVLPAGHRLRAVDLGLLAEVGREQVLYYDQPRVAILATGNELVPAGQTPGPGQIRNSNEPLLDALVRELGVSAIPLGIARDDYDDLTARIACELETASIVMLSGGVSEGVADLAPRVLSDLGVRQVFHKVNLKPGKPLWFGVKEREGGERTLVFGLPGNPVSTLVCFQLFVRPAIEQLSGREPLGMPRFEAALAAPFNSRGDRPTYWPGKAVPRLRSPHAPREESGSGATAQTLVEPLAWQGSGDLRTLANADCFLFFPPGQKAYATNESVDAFRL